MSTDGASVSLGCYAVTAGSVIVDAATPTKTLALLSANGFVDVSTTTALPLPGAPLIALHSALFVPSTGTPGFVFSAHGGEAGALVWQALGGSPGAEWVMPQTLGAGVGVTDARCLGAFNGTLYGTDSSADASCNGVSAVGTSVGAGIDLQSAVLQGTTLVGAAAANPWAFVFESAASLWVADTGAPSTYNLVHYGMAGTTWAATKTVLLTAGTSVIYSISVRATHW